MQLFINPDEMRALYAESPDWLRDLMDAWADGLNFFLHTHPEVRPLVLDRFEPWMALTFSEGSIGGDIERVNLRELEAFYGNEENRQVTVGALPGAVPGAAPAPATGASDTRDPRPLRIASSLVTPDPELEPTGSNGIAIAPENTVDGHALLLINPHTSFYFRHEAQVVSDEGLNVYGALTWGQFFVYQGFNETAGWMHTSSSADNIDEFLETVVERDSGLHYVVGDEERPLQVRDVTLRYRTEAGPMEERTFTTYRTHRGPVVRSVDGRWVSVAMMEEPLRALIQSYSRTKARNLAEYLEVMETHTNSSNNTLFADAEGNIAYLHSNFVPVRDTRFDYSEPVDGSDPATDWQGVHTLDESPNAINPSTGYAFCTNNWPYSAAGAASPRPGDFPAYMDRGQENPRGIHALRVLDGRRDFTLEDLRAAAYSPDLPAFDAMVPALVQGWDELPAGDALKARTAEAIEELRGWDRRWSVESVPTALAVFWGTEFLSGMAGAARDAGLEITAYAATRTTATERLEALEVAMDRLEEDFGDWRTPWGEINRFQRLTGEIDLPFDDDAPVVARRLHLGPVGIPGLLRRRSPGRHEAVVRHQRQQLRGRGGVRRAGPCRGRDGRGAEQRPGLPPLQRPGRTLRRRRPETRVLLPRRRGSRRPAHLPSGGPVSARGSGEARGRAAAPWSRRASRWTGSPALALLLAAGLVACGGGDPEADDAADGPPLRGSVAGGPPGAGGGGMVGRGGGPRPGGGHLPDHPRGDGPLPGSGGHRHPSRGLLSRLPGAPHPGPGRPGPGHLRVARDVG
jgi:acyl-homoserine-lactone acylase